MICRKSEVYHGKYPRSREKRKIFLYRFTACLGKDEKGWQIRRYRTWQVPQGLSPVRAERAAQRAADEWEKSLKIDPSEAEIPPAVHSCDFTDFVNEVWLPLRIQNGTNKPVTVTFHRNNAKRLTEYFKGRSHAENHSDRHSALSNLSPHGIQEHKGKASRDKDGLPSLRDVGADIQLR